MRKHAAVHASKPVCLRTSAVSDPESCLARDVAAKCSRWPRESSPWWTTSRPPIDITLHSVGGM
jgi:hypothetical protein